MYSECSQAARANLWPVGLKPLAWISYADSLIINLIYLFKFEVINNNKYNIYYLINVIN